MKRKPNKLQGILKLFLTYFPDNNISKDGEIGSTKTKLKLNS